MRRASSSSMVTSGFDLFSQDGTGSRIYVMDLIACRSGRHQGREDRRSDMHGRKLPENCAARRAELVRSPGGGGTSQFACLTPLLIRMEACVRRLSQKESESYYTPDPVSAIVSGDCRLRSERGRTSNDRAGSLRRVGMLCGQRRTGQAIEKSAACDCTCVMVLSFPQRLGSADAKMIAPSLLA